MFPLSQQKKKLPSALLTIANEIVSTGPTICEYCAVDQLRSLRLTINTPKYTLATMARSLVPLSGSST